MSVNTPSSISSLQARMACRLEQARRHRGWSQRQMGIRMGLAPQTGSSRINRYEHGQSALSMEAFEHIAHTLGLPHAYFVVDDDRLAQKWLEESPAPSVSPLPETLSQNIRALR